MKSVKRKPNRVKKRYPIAHWSYSSLIAYLRNPLAWYKRYCERIYDTPRGRASIVGSAGHTALEHFYSGVEKSVAIQLGLEYMEAISDFEIDFGKRTSAKSKREARAKMRTDYLRAINFYLEKPPRHRVLGIEVKGVAKVHGVPLPLKAVSDLVVASPRRAGAVDIIDHKFVESWSTESADAPLYLIQAIFNYYTVSEIFKKPIERFIIIECKKSKNKDGSPQLRKHVFYYSQMGEVFTLTHTLLKDASADILTRKKFLPNPSDMFEGRNSLDIYKLGLL